MAVKRFRRSAGNANVVMEVKIPLDFSSPSKKKQGGGRRSLAARLASSSLDLQNQKPHPLLFSSPSSSSSSSSFPNRNQQTNQPTHTNPPTGQATTPVRKLPGQGQAQGQGGPDEALQEVPVPGDDRRGLCRLWGWSRCLAAGALRRVLLSSCRRVCRELDGGARVKEVMGSGGRKDRERESSPC